MAVKKISVSLPEDLNKRLEQEARRLDISKSEVIQRWIIKYTEEER